MMNSEVFVANEYYSPCADNTTYNFKCDTGEGEYGGLYDES